MFIYVFAGVLLKHKAGLWGDLKYIRVSDWRDRTINLYMALLVNLYQIYVVDFKWREGCFFPVRVSFWHQWLDSIEQNLEAVESRTFFSAVQRLCSIRFVFFFVFLVTSDWYDETTTSLFFCLVRESLYNFLFSCAATRLVPNVWLCIAVEMQCVFRFPDYFWSSKQEVVITLIVLLIGRTIIQELPWLLWGKIKTW